MGIGPARWVRRPWEHAFLRFLVMGALNTAIGYTVYAIGITSGLPRYAALLCASILGILLSFKTIGTIVFGNRDRALLPRFVLVYVASYIFNLALLEVYCRAAKFGPLLGQALSIPFVVTFVYWAMKSAVFRRARPSIQGGSSRT